MGGELSIPSNSKYVLNKSNLEIELLKLMDNIMREAVSVESLYVN